MKIGIIGAGRIGGNAASLFAKEGHEVMLSYSRDPAHLETTAAAIGARASVGTPAEAVEFGKLVMLAVPWARIDDVVSEVGSFGDKVVIDTTNQFAEGGLVELPDGKTAAQVNAERLEGARYVKAFNTLTAGFQGAAAGRSGDERAVMFLCGDDDEAKDSVKRLIREVGFAPVDVGGTADAAVMEPPRREGAVYGEEFKKQDALEFLEKARAG